jgi:hypothetical protein
MWKLAALLLCATLGWSADKDAADPWEKVKNLKTGSDLRIYKTGGGEPISAKSADVTARKLVVIIGNEETAINKADIERVDYQPPAGKPVKTKTYEATPDSASISYQRSNSR